MPEEKVTYNPCMGTGCHEFCVIETHVIDGKIEYTKRMRVPGTGECVTGICQKGIEYAKFPYLEHPNRLQYPLKRVGERGEEKFERISWDQALDEIGAKLVEIRDAHGPNAVLVNTFDSSYPDAMFSMHGKLSNRFVNAFGASIFPYVAADAGIASTCVTEFGSVFFDTFPYDVRNLKNAKYILVWASNAIGQNRVGHTTSLFLDAKEQGCKIVDVGILFDTSAALSDEFVAIKPATDIYLAQSMAHIIFRDRLYDTAFINAHTNLPFLVRDDTGKMLRASEIIVGGCPDDYVIWDATTKAPIAVAPHSALPQGAEPDLFAKMDVAGIACTTALKHVYDSVAGWTPEAQENLTGVPAETVERIVRDYVEIEDSLLYIYEGMRYQNAGPACRAIMMLPVLTGRIGKGRAGGLGIVGMGGYAAALNDVPVMIPFDPAQIKAKFPMSLTEMFDAGFPYKAFFNVCSNPVECWPNTRMWAEDIFPKLDLIVSFEVRMSDTAKYADYILPDATTLQRAELTCKDGYLIYCEPAIDAGDSKDSCGFWSGLAERVGLGEYFDKTTEEWLELRLQTDDPAVTGIEPPLTFERLKKEKIVRLNVPEEPFDIWGNMDFSTRSGRIEPYSEIYTGVGQAVPAYFDPCFKESRNSTYPLQLMVGRHRVLCQSMFGEFKLLRKLSAEKPYAKLNPAEAKQRGLAEGDLVEVFNGQGSFTVPLLLSNAIPKGLLWVPYAFRAKEWKGDPPQMLMTEMGGLERHTALNQAYVDDGLSRMPFPETFGIEYHLATEFETYWDNACDIRKAKEEVAK